MLTLAKLRPGGTNSRATAKFQGGASAYCARRVRGAGRAAAGGEQRAGSQCGWGIGAVGWADCCATSRMA